ncbi:MAG TPA: sigma-70 family RNA polymerase sigma factor [Kofleriaceae bacterium]|nr:sigma-70 family RNA polymerase sigma factor [Kofleriaceae bacterium]
MSNGAIIEFVARKSSTTSNLRALTDEAELIRRCRAGERRAEEEFYQRYRNQVAANLYRVMNTRTDLDDLVQEVFVIAFRGLERFRGDARLSTWMYRICVNVALGRIRSKTRRPPPILTDQPIGETPEASPEHPRQLLERQQERARVHRILETMPAKKRIVLFLHEIEGLDLKEISYVLGVNPVTVRTRLFYARREFYRLIAEEGM